MARRMTHEEYVERIKDTGIEVNEEYKNNKTKIKHTCTKCGRKDWMVRPRDVLSGARICLKCNGSEKITHVEYIRRLDTIGIEVNEKYKNTTTPIRHTCTKCGRKNWMVSPSNILRGTKICEKCSNELSESIMASTLKQVLKRELGEEVILEYDAGYRGMKGGISKYDIFIKPLNTLVECQSKYHDTHERVQNDSLKREYSINKGYKLIELDSRNYTPLKAVQLFLPHIRSIPKYVKIGKQIKEIKGRRKSKMVVQLNGSGQIVNRFNINEKTYEKGTYRYNMRHCVMRAGNGKNNGTHYYKGYYWYYEEDYNKLKGGI